MKKNYLVVKTYNKKNQKSCTNTITNSKTSKLVSYYLLYYYFQR